MLVVMIHTHAMPTPLEPLLSIAVPCFFIISSYLFWHKISDKKQLPGSTAKFVKRNLRLYIFWFIVLIVPTTFINRWFAGDISVTSQLIQILRDFLFWELFPASWFLMALPLGMLIISFLINRINANNFVLAIIALFAYFICWMDHFSWGNTIIDSILSNIKIVIPHLSNSFVIAIPYIVIGKLLAECNWERKHFSWLPFIIGLSFIFLFIERTFYNEIHYEGLYFSIPLLSASIFIYILQIKEKEKKDLQLLRRTSVIIYCSHKTIAILLNTFLRHVEMGELNGIWLFIVTLLISILFAILILFCTSKLRVKLLSYAY